MLDVGSTENASVSVKFGADTIITGWKELTDHVLTADFYKAESNPLVSFNSTSTEADG